VATQNSLALMAVTPIANTAPLTITKPISIR
jgi:hypothetical protein